MSRRFRCFQRQHVVGDNTWTDASAPADSAASDFGFKVAIVGAADGPGLSGFARASLSVA